MKLNTFNLEKKFFFLFASPSPLPNILNTYLKKKFKLIRLVFLLFIKGISNVSLNRIIMKFN